MDFCPTGAVRIIGFLKNNYHPGFWQESRSVLLEMPFLLEQEQYFYIKIRTLSKRIQHTYQIRRK
jgi:hypothetical protein